MRIVYKHFQIGMQPIGLLQHPIQCMETIFLQLPCPSIHSFLLIRCSLMQIVIFPILCASNDKQADFHLWLAFVDNIFHWNHRFALLNECLLTSMHLQCHLLYIMHMVRSLATLHSHWSNAPWCAKHMHVRFPLLSITCAPFLICKFNFIKYFANNAICKMWLWGNLSANTIAWKHFQWATKH